MTNEYAEHGIALLLAYGATADAQYAHALIAHLELPPHTDDEAAALAEEGLRYFAALLGVAPVPVEAKGDA